MGAGAGAGRALAVRGFTLLEVVVALLILSTSGLMLFSWINQNLATAARLRDAQARAQLHTEGVSWLSVINPALEGEGEREQGGLRLSWRSTLVEPMRNEFNYGGMLVPRWTVGLYRVDATITRIDSKLEARWQQMVSGWQPAIQVAPPPGGRP